MPSNLFKFLLAHLRFDDKTKRELWKQDHFLAMRDIFQIFAGNCKRALVPEEFFSLDETLYATRVGDGIWTEQLEQTCKVLITVA